MYTESVNQLRKKVHEDYEKIARSFSATRVFAWKDFSLFDPYRKPDAIVLDVGCGNGRLLEYLKGKFVSYVGIDQISYFIEESKKKFGKPGVSFEVADLIDWKTDKKFDEVFCIAVLHHIVLSLRLEVVKKWYTWVKPGGFVFVTCWNVWQKKYRWYLWGSWFRSWFGGGKNDVYIPFQKKVKRYVHAFTKEELRDLMVSAGFEVVFCDYVSEGQVVSPAEAKNIVLIARKPVK